MRPGLLIAALLLGGCASAPPEAAPPGVRVEVVQADGAVQPPVFRWDAPVAARVTVLRGPTVVWEVAEGDTSHGAQRRGPIVPPLTYGERYGRHLGPRPRVLVPPAALTPRTVYTVSVVGYDGTVYRGRFSVNERVDIR